LFLRIIIELSNISPVKPRPAPAKSRTRPVPAADQTSGWDYAPAPESVNPGLRGEYGLFIDGKWRRAASGETRSIINPATENELAVVAAGGPADIDAAVQAARRAYAKVWSKTSGLDRGKYLYRVARLLQEKSRELAVLETMNGGKPIRESRDFDLPQAAAHFFFYAGWADKLKYALPGREPRPLGVAGQIIP